MRNLIMASLVAALPATVNADPEPLSAGGLLGLFSRHDAALIEFGEGYVSGVVEAFASISPLPERLAKFAVCVPEHEIRADMVGKIMLHIAMRLGDDPEAANVPAEAAIIGSAHSIFPCKQT